MPSKTFSASIFLLLTSLILQFFLGAALGVWINFVFAALAAAAFFLEALWLIVLVLLAVFLLNWQPTVGVELIFMGGLPLVFFYVKERFPWQAWITNIFFIFAGIAALYAVFGAFIFLAAPQIFLIDAFGALLFGAAAFWVLEKTSG